MAGNLLGVFLRRAMWSVDNNSFKHTSKEKDLDLQVPRKRDTIVHYPETVDSSSQEVTLLKRTLNVLQEEVRRLNAELSRYQAKYPPVISEIGQENLGITIEDPLPPWLLNIQYLSPLFLSYDERIEELEQQIVYFKQQQESDHSKLKTLISENEQLRNQVKRTLEEKLQRAERDDVLGGTTAVNSDSLDEYKERLIFLQEENDVLLSLQSNLQEQIEQLREENAERVHLHHSLEQYKEKAKQRNVELEALSKSKQELTAATIDLERILHLSQKKETEYTKELKAMKEEYSTAINELDKLRRTKEELFQKITNLEAALEQQQIKYITIQKQSDELKESNRLLLLEIENTRRDREQLFDTSVSLQRRFEESQHKEAEALRIMIESLEKLEETKLEKEQSLLSEEVAQKEVDKLLEKFDLQKIQMEQTLESQLNSLKLSHKKQVNTLCNEINNLETSNSDIKAQMDRLLREKKSVEIELDRIKKEPSSESTRYCELVDELRRKLALLERERDELNQRVEGLLVNEKRSTSKWQKERTTLEYEVSELQRRTKRTELEYKEDIIKLQSKTEELQRDNMLLLSQKEELAARQHQESVQFSKQLERQKREYEEQYESIKVALNRAHSEVAMLQDMREKWKNELKNSTIKFEKTLAELRDENIKLNSKNDMMNDRLTKITTEKNFLSDKFLEVQRNVQYLQSVAQTNEQRNIDTTMHLSTLMNKESELVKENNSLQNKLDLMSVEQSRLSKELETTRKSLNELRSNLKRSENEKSSLQVELKTTNEASLLLSGHISKLEERIKAKRSRRLM